MFKGSSLVGTFHTNSAVALISVPVMLFVKPVIEIHFSGHKKQSQSQLINVNQDQKERLLDHHDSTEFLVNVI